MNARPDDLRRPFGLAAPKKMALRRAHLFVGIAGSIAAGAAGLFLLTLSRPSGEPFAVATIRIRESIPIPSPPMEEPGVADHSGSAAGPGPVPVRLAPSPDPRLVERTRYGMLPRVGSDGTRPAKVYARPVSHPALAGPRVAVLVGGLGIGATATAEAIEKLPPSVTLAFAPYGTELERTVADAREAGHEVMLQVPMEPFDYPDDDPGPHTLTTRARLQENIERLQWVMGRFTGYFGVVNLMGAKLTADNTALEPILAEVGSRGLVFFDDGSSARSVVAPGHFASVPTGRAHLVLDSDSRPEAIDRELKVLEDLARKNMLAIGTASAHPASIDRIARWATELSAKGIQLVPVSSAIEQQASR